MANSRKKIQKKGSKKDMWDSVENDSDFTTLLSGEAGGVNDQNDPFVGNILMPERQSATLNSISTQPFSGPILDQYLTEADLPGKCP